MSVFQYGIYSRKEKKIILLGIVSKWSLNSAFNFIEKKRRADGIWDDQDTILMAVQYPFWKFMLMLLPFSMSFDFGGFRLAEKRDGKWKWQQ